MSRARTETVAELFDENLRRVRRCEGLSQERLAARALLHRAEVGKLERAGRVCRIDTLIRLAGAMAVPPGGLREGIDWVPGPEPWGAFVLGAGRWPARGRPERPMRQISKQTKRKETEPESPSHTRRQSQRSPKAERRKGKTRPPRKAGAVTTGHPERPTTEADTANPPVPCLGRTFSAVEVHKRRAIQTAPSTAPAGGRLWHGFAVRRPLLGGDGGALTFGPFQPGPHDLRSGGVQTPLPPDRECMRSRAPGPTFFTERTLAAYLAVSDRTIRNWIRRGQLPSYKLGASRRIDPADVEDFLARHRDSAA